MSVLLQNFGEPAFWIAVGQIIGVNMVLSGDNAVVIALACRLLPSRQRLWGMALGAGAAVLLRVIFTFVVAQAMAYPYIKLAGGVLLLWVAIKLVVPERGDSEDRIAPAENLWRAVRIVVIADIVMSLDNVVAIAASAESAAIAIDVAHAPQIKALLIFFGLATSVPLIVAGSTGLMALLERFPVLVWAGAGLLGWVAGDIMAGDAAMAGWLGLSLVRHLELWVSAAGAIFVIGVGYILSRWQRPQAPDV